MRRVRGGLWGGVRRVREGLWGECETSERGRVVRRVRGGRGSETSKGGRLQDQQPEKITNHKSLTNDKFLSTS